MMEGGKGFSILTGLKYRNGGKDNNQLTQKKGETTMRTISIDKIDLKSFLRDYRKLKKKCSTSEKIEILFDAKGKFTGHLWSHNCFYTESDLERNGDYAPDHQLLEYIYNLDQAY